jgi:xanthine dehydrogenase FAD-binding subunit
MTDLQPCRPATLAALSAVMNRGGPLHLIAGGTDLLVAGRVLPTTGRLIDLTALPALRGIDCSGPDIRIGATTTAAQIEHHAGLVRRFPALVQAAAECGSVQIRNRATIAGNIANAAAAADLIPPLLLAGACLEGIAPDGSAMVMPLQDHTRACRLLITAVILPAGGHGPTSAFVKLGPRRDLTIARLNMAATADMRGDRLFGLRLIAGALGPRPISLARAATVLEGQRLTATLLCGFLDALTAEVDAAIPGRASQSWKRQAIRGLGIDLVARLMNLTNRDPLFEGAR